MTKPMRDHLKNRFVRLIGAKGSWHNFMKYIWKEKDREWVKYHENSVNFLFNRDPEDWVQFAFRWGKSQEGTSFWSGLNKKWLSILSKDYNIQIR